ncbi:hypothetical protein SO694_00081153 [Aureococcus anophagefferens]|uniref:Uncharacterized protein n=1 Tax=Aureococcus anophagefferens TaxID=44056 RepID=A0ABR1G4V4_AURAN
MIARPKISRNDLENGRAPDRAGFALLSCPADDAVLVARDHEVAVHLLERLERDAVASGAPAGLSDATAAQRSTS